MLYGADLQILYNPIKGLSFFNISKYTYGKIKSGDPLPLISPFKNIVSVQYQRNSWIVQAENETSQEQNRINKNYGEQKTPAFSIFNIKVSYTFQLSGKVLDVSLGITNLFNRAYYEHLDWGRIYRPEVWMRM